MGCISTRRKPPEEDCDRDGAGEEGDVWTWAGRAPHKCNFS